MRPTDVYPLSPSDIAYIESKLTMGEDFEKNRIWEEEGRAFGFTQIFHKPGAEYKVKFMVTPWRQPSNQLVEIGYICLLVHDERQNILDGWQYFYFSMIEGLAMPNKSEFERWNAVSIADQCNVFLQDSLLAPDDRQFKPTVDLDNSGRWNGGVESLPALFIPRKAAK